MATGLSIAAIAVALVSAAAAVYAVLLSRRGLAWRKQQDIARVTPTVSVEIEHGLDPRTEHAWNPSDILDGRPLPLEYRLTVSVVNQGQRPEHLKRLRIEAADHSEGLDLKGIGQDVEIQPRARHLGIVPLANVPKWESGFVAIATLAGGDEFTSDVEHAYDDLLADVEKRNRHARP